MSNPPSAGAWLLAAFASAANAAPPELIARPNRRAVAPEPPAEAFAQWPSAVRAYERSPVRLNCPSAVRNARYRFGSATSAGCDEGGATCGTASGLGMGIGRGGGG